MSGPSQQRARRSSASGSPRGHSGGQFGGGGATTRVTRAAAIRTEGFRLLTSPEVAPASAPGPGARRTELGRADPSRAGPARRSLSISRVARIVGRHHEDDAVGLEDGPALGLQVMVVSTTSLELGELGGLAVGPRVVVVDFGEGA